MSADDDLATLRAETSRFFELTQNAPAIARTPNALREAVLALYDRGNPPGDLPGWPSLNSLYTVVPGQLTIVTGWPSSGKSEWLDAMLMNLAKRAGWRICLFSAENKPDEQHLTKLIEKFTGKPFREGPTERMTKDEAAEALGEIDAHFAVIGANFNAEKDTFAVEEVLNAAEAHWRSTGEWRDREAKKGLVIDPWNELEHLRPRQYSETEYVSATLSKVRAWAREHRVHVWIVAHPAKQMREAGKLPIPRPDMIAGSQHWWNKADCCITVHREQGENPTREVQVYVQKVRFKHVGKQGMATLEYDITNGRYNEVWKGLSRVAG